MKRILWLSRHNPLENQIEWLRQKYGEVQVIQDSKPFSSAEEIDKRYRDGSYDDMVVVAPLSVIAKLVDLKIRPLWAEMDEVPLDQAEVIADGRAGKRGYRFNRFRRIIGLQLTFEELD